MPGKTHSVWFPEPLENIFQQVKNSMGFETDGEFIRHSVRQYFMSVSVLKTAMGKALQSDNE